MATTIGNPLSWGIRTLGAAGHDIGAAARELGSEGAGVPDVRRIGVEDLRAALRLGIADFAALRSDVIVAALVYPIAGACLVSRRREAGESVGWGDAFGVLGSPRFGAILALALGHLVVFVRWILTAHLISQATMGDAAPTAVGPFLTTVLTTPAGWAMMAFGLPVGFLFACLVLVTSVVSFPLLLDRAVGLPVAVVTSVRVARRNPATVALWGLIVAVGLVLGSLPLLVGLAVVMPILGHATWHLYRRAVV